MEDAPEPLLPPPPPGLTLVATPIGNMHDLTPRALAALAGADAILCEDTRVTAKLLARHALSIPLRPLHDHNEEEQVARILRDVRAGQRLVLVSDAGTPLVSDPGFRVVRALLAEGLAVHAVPGANAAVMALVLSGLPPQPFLFLGFLPARDGARDAAIAGLKALEAAGLRATTLFYEAPQRVAATLAALATALGEARPAALARELTKRFEEVRRGSLRALADGALADPPRGEVVLVVGPAPERAPEAASLDAALATAMAGMSVRDAAESVARALGLPRKTVYARALELAGRG